MLCVVYCTVESCGSSSCSILLTCHVLNAVAVIQLTGNHVRVVSFQITISFMSCNLLITASSHSSGHSFMHPSLHPSIELIHSRMHPSDSIHSYHSYHSQHSCITHLSNIRPIRVGHACSIIFYYHAFRAIGIFQCHMVLRYYSRPDGEVE